MASYVESRRRGMNLCNKPTIKSTTVTISGTVRGKRFLDEQTKYRLFGASHVGDFNPPGTVDHLRATGLPSVNEFEIFQIQDDNQEK